MPPHPFSNWYHSLIAPISGNGNTVPPVAQARNLGLDFYSCLLVSSDIQFINKSCQLNYKNCFKCNPLSPSQPQPPRLSHVTFTASGQEIPKPHLSDSTPAPYSLVSRQHYFKCLSDQIWLRGLHYSAPVILGSCWGHSPLKNSAFPGHSSWDALSLDSP